MDLKEIVSISSMGGLFKVVATRNDGLIVKPFGEDKASFVSNRIHVFTPLDGITIYTNEDSTELSKVFPEMKKQESSNPPAEIKSNNDAFKDYFRKILPDYDEERVYVSDIKKIIKWYHALNEHGLVMEEKPEPKAKDLEEKAKTPKKTKAKKAKKKPAKDKEE